MDPDDELFDGVDDADHFFLTDDDIQDIIDDVPYGRDSDDDEVDSEFDGEYAPPDDDDDEDEDEDEDEEDEEDDDEDNDPATVPYPGSWPGRVYVVDGGDDSESDSGADNVLGPTQLLEFAALLNSTGGMSVTQRSAILQNLLGRNLGLSGAWRQRTAEENSANRRRPQWRTPQKEPNPAGLALLRSGDFGPVGPWTPGSVPEKRGRRPGERRGRMPVFRSAEPTIPNTHGTIVAQYSSVPYVAQYAGPDYGLFYAATQHFTLHLYSPMKQKAVPRGYRPPPPRAPAHPYHTLYVGDDEESDESDEDPWGRWSDRHGIVRADSSMHLIKNVNGEEGRWTVTDADADRLGERIIYSSITPHVHMMYTGEHDSEHTMLDFSSRDGIMGHEHFGIWSIRFSADGWEVVAGTGGQADSGRIMIYDIGAQRRTLSIPAHRDDVNAVCFADEGSTNILISGSDDGYVKVWDRRSLSSNEPSGVLVGATQGITYCSPKGDGRYIVVNSKDQAARLYDLRMMRSWNEFKSEPDAVVRWGQAQFDYRGMSYYPSKRLAHPRDCSVMTYRGHSVLKTLIRCHFSPIESTGQSYIYSGSADGLIHIWSLDGRVVQVLNRAESIPLHSADNRSVASGHTQRMSRLGGAGGVGGRLGPYNDPSAPEPERYRRRLGAYPNEDGISWTVRDVAWHGYEPTLMSTAWHLDGQHRSGGSVAKHEWKGLGKGGMKSLEDWVEKAQQETAR